MSFGERLAEIRKGKGYSQEELSKKLGMSPKTIGRWERGETLPALDDMPALSKALGVSIAYLLGEADIEEQKTVQEEIAVSKESMQALIPTKETPDEGTASIDKYPKKKKWIAIAVISVAAVTCIAVALVIYIYHLLTNEPFEEHRRVETTTSVIEVNWSQMFLFIGILLLVGVIIFVIIKIIINKNKKRSDENEVK